MISSAAAEDLGAMPINGPVPHPNRAFCGLGGIPQTFHRQQLFPSPYSLFPSP